MSSKIKLYSDMIESVFDQFNLTPSERSEVVEILKQRWIKEIQVKESSENTSKQST